MKKIKIVSYLFLIIILFLLIITCKTASNIVQNELDQTTNTILETRIKTIDSGNLKIGMTIDYEPMEYYSLDGITPIGFDVSLGRQIAQKLDLKPEFINVDWFELLTIPENYDIIISSLVINSARQSILNFSKPYISNFLIMVLPINSRITVKNPNELFMHNVAFLSDTLADTYLNELITKYGLIINKHLFENIEKCFEQLTSGNVDVVITDIFAAYKYIAHINSPFKIVWRGEYEYFGIANIGNVSLIKAIDSVLEELFEKGTMLRFSNEFFGMDIVTEARKNW